MGTIRVVDILQADTVYAFNVTTCYGFSWLSSDTALEANPTVEPYLLVYANDWLSVVGKQQHLYGRNGMGE
jgi:hypothetical protein